MKKYLLLIALLVSAFAYNPTFACDVCGCSLGGNYFGILPQYYQNFVGVRYSQAHFSATMNHDSEYLDNEFSNDTYRKVELWGRFYLTDRIQLFGFIPYAFNDMDGSHQKVRVSGLGDITALVNYTFINTGEDMTKNWRHTLLAGGGIKVPTGRFDHLDQGTLVNPNFQLGTGSVDYLVSGVYTVRYKSIGLNAEAAYKMNTSNSEGYLFGNQFNTSAQLFYWYQKNIVALLPNIGMYYEQAQKHEEEGIRQANTGGKALFGHLGLDVYYYQFSLGVSYKEPWYQRMNSDDIANIKTHERVSVDFTYSF